MEERLNFDDFMLFYGARHFTYFLHCTSKEFKFAAVIYDFFYFYFYALSTFLLSFSLLTFTMERESELRASDPFIAK